MTDDRSDFKKSLFIENFPIKFINVAIFAYSFPLSIPSLPTQSLSNWSRYRRFFSDHQNCVFSTIEMLERNLIFCESSRFIDNFCLKNLMFIFFIFLNYLIFFYWKIAMISVIFLVIIIALVPFITIRLIFFVVITPSFVIWPFVILLLIIVIIIVIVIEFIIIKLLEVWIF